MGFLHYLMSFITELNFRPAHVELARAGGADLSSAYIGDMRRNKGERERKTATNIVRDRAMALNLQD